MNETKSVEQWLMKKIDEMEVELEVRRQKIVALEAEVEKLKQAKPAVGDKVVIAFMPDFEKMTAIPMEIRIEQTKKED